VTRTDPATVLAALDPEQRAVAQTLEGPLVVIAGAGTGKTRAITHRIAYGALTDAFDPRSVLAVTFTTRAAGELRSRLHELGVAGVQARTFHAAALRQAQYFWPRAYGSQLPPVSEARMSMVADAAARLRLRPDQAQLRDLVGEVSWAKVSNITVGDYPEVAASAGRSVSGFEPSQVARLLATYEEVKRDRGRIDFDDILLCTAALLSDVPEVAAAVRAQYRHFVVDEYQDVSPLQHTVLKLWLGERHELCVVGDPAQTIHTFAGARSSYLTGFRAEHPGARVIELVRDYRSTPQVVRTANAVMKRQRSGVTLQAQRPDGPEPSYAESPSESAEAAGVASWLASLSAQGVAWAQMAVLYRINAQSPALEASLAERGIPYVVRGADKFYERSEVRQALVALRSAARAETDEPGLDAVRGVLGGAGWTPEPPSGAGAVRERWESLAALVALAEELEATEPGHDLAWFVAELDRRAELQHVPSAQGVTLSTIHAAKGLEWDAVAVYGVHEGSLPFVLATGDEQLAEERRLLYVAITRAREHLRLSWSTSRSGQGARRGPSRFLDGIRPADSHHEVAETGRRRRGRSTTLARTCRVCSGHLRTPADQKLGRHESCPSSYDEATLDALKTWRSARAAEQKLPAYCVFTDATLVAVAEAQPADQRALLAIPGIGAAKLAKYGDDVLSVLADARAQ